MTDQQMFITVVGARYRLTAEIVSTLGESVSYDFTLRATCESRATNNIFPTACKTRTNRSSAFW